jgi:hypothetical protein
MFVKGRGIDRTMHVLINERIRTVVLYHKISDIVTHSSNQCATDSQ